MIKLIRINGHKIVITADAILSYIGYIKNENSEYVSNFYFEQIRDFYQKNELAYKSVKLDELMKELAEAAKEYL